MAHIKKLNFLKNHKDLVDENYGMVAVPTFSDKMDKDLAESVSYTHLTLPTKRIV